MDSTFENLKFNPFNLNNNILLNNLTDPDVNLFNENQNMDTPYLQSWPKIMTKTVKNGVVLDTTSNIKIFSETIWSA